MITKDIDFVLFPNRVNQDAQVDVIMDKAVDLTMDVIDKIGKRFYSYTASAISRGMHSFEMNTTDFAKGIYTVNIKSDTGSSQKKLVVE